MFGKLRSRTSVVSKRILKKRLAVTREASGWHPVESLESRLLLTGTWTSITNAVPSSDGAENAMLLTDGTVMVHGGAAQTSNKWYKLTPSNGNYVSGTWTTLASSVTSRLFFPSEVLPTGQVLIVGGEYSSAGGFINTGEIYNPVTNTWSGITTFPNSQYGDDPTELLPNGNVLSGYVNSAATYIYNPTANTWTATGTKMRSDQSDEESWVTLPDGSILSYDVFSSVSTGTPHAQRYIPSSGTWVDAGNPPAQLSAANVGYELGPGILLPDGRVFYAGGTNATAYYTPGVGTAAGTWAAGPNMPGGYVMADAPGAILPNGNLLLAMSPKGALSGSSYNFPSPTKVYELNVSTNVYTDVTPAVSGFSVNLPSYQTTFLVLPTGQILMTNDSGKIAIYTPSGSPSSSWAPTISNITNDQGTNTFTVSGYQLNGISEGAAYGDDDEMSSNYPIVRLTDQAGNITFARTFNWSTGVASVSSSFNFTEPSTGAYLVNVIANGIASPTVLNLQCSSTTGENFIAQANANTNYLDFNLIGAGVVATFNIGSFNTLIMTGDAASNTLVINDNLFGRNTIINGGDAMDYLRVENNGTGYVSENGGNGNDYFDFGFYGQNLSNQAGFVYVYGGAGTNSVFMYDKNYNTASSTYTLDAAEVNRPGFGGMFYDANVAGLTVNTGTGANNNFNISSTYYVTPVFVNANAFEYVNIGAAGSVQSIAAAITLTDSPSYMVINVDDSADTTSTTTTIGTYTPSGDTAYGSISGLAPGQINYRFADTSSVAVATGTAATNVVNIQATSKPLTLNGGAGTRTVTIGNSTQGVQGIVSPVTLNASSGSETLTVDDSADTAAARTTTLNYTTINGYTSQAITGLAPALIAYYLSGTTALTIKTGRVDGNITNIQQLSIPTSIIGASDTQSDDTVNIGNAGSLASVTGALTITNPSGYTDINVNDYADTSTVTYTLSSFYTGVTPYGQLVFPTYTLFGSLVIYNTLNFTHYDIKTLTLNIDPSATANISDTSVNTVINEPSGGSGPAGATLIANVQATSAPLTINTTNDEWTVNATNAGSAQSLNGAITITSSGFGSEGALNVDDSVDTTPRIVSISDSQIIGMAPATITYPNYRTEFNVSGGSGGNTFTVSTTPVGGLYPTNVLNDGAGSDTVTVNATQASFSSGALLVNTGTGNDQVTLGTGTLSNFANPVTVVGGSGSDSVLLADQSLSAADTYNVSSTTVSRPNFGGLTYSALSSLRLEAETGNNIINVNATAVGTPVTIGANAGTDTINVNQTDPTAPVTIEPSTGNDAVNVGTTGSPGATAIFAASQSIGLLTIGNKGVAIEAAGPRILLQDNGVVTSGSGVLNQITNDTITHSGSLAAISALIKSGYNAAGGGNWAGPGIDSSAAAANLAHLTAVGSILNTYDGGTNTIFNASHLFDGVAPSVTDVLTKYTYYGDANLDGKVDGSDYSRIDAGYVAQLGGWYNGDFNYDGVVNGSDYTLIDNAFNTQGASLAAEVATPAALVTVPIASRPFKPATVVALSQFTKPVAISQNVSGGKGIHAGLDELLGKLAGRVIVQSPAPSAARTAVTLQKRTGQKTVKPTIDAKELQVAFLS